MKISELIAALQEKQAQCGDLDVYLDHWALADHPLEGSDLVQEVAAIGIAPHGQLLISNYKLSN